MRVTAVIISHFDRATSEAMYSVYVGWLLAHGGINLKSRHTKQIAVVGVSHLYREAHVFNAEIARQFATPDAPAAPWYKL